MITLILVFGLATRLAGVARRQGRREWGWILLFLASCLVLCVLTAASLMKVAPWEVNMDMAAGMSGMVVTVVMYLVLERILTSIAPGRYLKKPAPPKPVEPQVAFTCAHCKTSSTVFASQRGSVVICLPCGKTTMVPPEAPVISATA